MMLEIRGLASPQTLNPNMENVNLHYQLLSNAKNKNITIIEKKKRR